MADSYNIVVLFTTESIVLYSIFSKKMLIEVLFEEMVHSATKKIRHVVRFNCSHLEIKYLILDSDNRLYLLNLFDLSFLKFDFNTQNLTLKDNLYSVYIENFFVFEFRHKIDAIRRNLHSITSLFAIGGGQLVKLAIFEDGQNCLSHNEFITALPLKIVS